MAKRNGLTVQQKIGQRIRQLRSDRQLSQETLGLKAGLDRTYINSVENGRRNISIRFSPGKLKPCTLKTEKQHS